MHDKKKLHPAIPVLIAAMMVLAACFAAPVSASEEGRWYTPVQISLWNPVQVFPDTWGVFLVSINLIYGSNAVVIGIEGGLLNGADHLYGFQAGMVNKISFATFGSDVNAGAQCGLANICFASLYGVQLGAFLNIAGKNVGAQVSFLNISFGLTGVQAGAINLITGGRGFQIGLANLSPDSSGGFLPFGNGSYGGMQIGAVYNYANELYGIQVCALINSAGDSSNGVQIGIINLAKSMRGVQIGLINYAVRMSGVQIGLINIIREGAIPFLPIFNASFRY